MVFKIGLSGHGFGSIGHGSGLVQSFSPKSVRTRIRPVKSIIFFFHFLRPLPAGSPPCAGKAPPLAVHSLQNPHPRTLETRPFAILLEKPLLAVSRQQDPTLPAKPPSHPFLQEPNPFARPHPTTKPPIHPSH